MGVSGGVRLAGCAAALLLAFGAADAGAKTFEVTKKGDPAPGQCKASDCSLREAVLAANDRPGADIAVLPSRKGAYKLTRPNKIKGVSENAGQLGDLDASGRLTVKHAGKGRARIDAGGIDRAFDLAAGSRVRLIKLKLVNGVATFPGPPPRAERRFGGNEGGAVRALGATLDVVRSSFTRNEGNLGGAIFSAPQTSVIVSRSKFAANSSFGQILTYGRLRVGRSTFTRNPVGPGVYPIGGGTFKRTTIAGNAEEGIRISGGSGTVRINASTISGNEGGGIRSQVDLRIVNSTVAGNDDTAIVFNDPGLLLTLVSSTIVDNSASTPATPGGLALNASSASVVNTILARNRNSEGDLADCEGNVDSEGGNLISEAGGCPGFEPGGGDFLATAIGLRQLAANGGPTKTMALKRGSPAIGKAVEAAAPKRDQRGRKRDNDPDSGAYEK